MVEAKQVPVEAILKDKGTDIWSVSPDTPAFDAMSLMSNKNIGSILVMSEGLLIGILSERDYARKVLLGGKASRKTLVGEIMTSPVITVSPFHSIDDCMRIITAKRIRHLPVVENEKVLGVISIGDLVNWIISTQEETIQYLHGYITGRYPG